MKPTTRPSRILIGAALLCVPVILASWWMLAGDRSDSGSAGKELPDEPILRQPADGGGHRSADAGGAPAASRAVSLEDYAEVHEFQEYASGLRKQGLPEETVRDLVASRITATYEARRAALRSGSLHGEGEVHQAQLDQLNREQGALIERLVGAAETPGSLAPAQQPVNGIDETPRDLVGKSPIMPAVMASTPPPAVQNDAQVDEWQKQRNGFVQAVGSADQNPNDPGYRKRWIQAQSQADERFRFWYGDNAYVAHQLKAMHEAQAQQ